MSFPFPDLPIITPPADERMSTAEKYGSLFYLGLIGLICLLALIGWFVYGVASHWSMWTNIYMLHDQTQTEETRVLAADRLAGDPRVNQRQYWDMVIRPELPAMARYRLAESLNAEATANEPSEYAHSVAYSTGWPAWLRVLMLRPMAYAVNRGLSFPEEPVRALRLMPDPFVKLWATYVQALQRGGDPVALAELETMAKAEGDLGSVARILNDSLLEKEPARTEKLNEATLRMRTASPEAAKVWESWVGRIGLAPAAAPKAAE